MFIVAVEVKLQAFVNWSLGKGNSTLLPAATSTKEKHGGIHWVGGWVGPRDDLDMVVDKHMSSSVNRTSVNRLIAIWFTV
jgi:hypothetical protein